MSKPMLNLFGKRHGRLIVRHEINTMISERTCAPGHIVLLNSNYLECIGYQDELLRQPRFVNITREITDKLERDYEETINDFLMGTGRL